MMCVHICAHENETVAELALFIPACAVLMSLPLWFFQAAKGMCKRLCASVFLNQTRTLSVSHQKCLSLENSLTKPFPLPLNRNVSLKSFENT